MGLLQRSLLLCHLLFYGCCYGYCCWLLLLLLLLYYGCYCCCYCRCCCRPCRRCRHRHPDECPLACFCTSFLKLCRRDKPLRCSLLVVSKCCTETDAETVVLCVHFYPSTFVRDGQLTVVATAALILPTLNERLRVMSDFAHSEGVLSRLHCIPDVVGPDCTVFETLYCRNCTIFYTLNCNPSSMTYDTCILLIHSFPCFPPALPFFPWPHSHEPWGLMSERCPDMATLWHSRALKRDCKIATRFTICAPFRFF